MIRPCASPGCYTLTFGDVCLGCLQRSAKAQTIAEQEEADRSADDALTAASAIPGAPSSTVRSS
jgi:hypothetical protein